MGHYNEPPFDISLSLPEEDHSQLVYDLQYDHNEGLWSIEQHFPDEMIQVLNYEMGIGIRRFQIEAPTGVAPRDTSMWHAVEPIHDCPHIESNVIMVHALNIGEKYLNSNACHECHDSSENWYCLTCGNVYCSRYVNSHGVAHFGSSGHPILISFSDLSFWCYSCEDYVLNDNLNIAKFTLHRAKFSESHPEERN